MENKEFHTLIISLLVHGLLAWLLWHAPDSWQIPQREQPVEITVIDKNSSKMIHTPKNAEVPPDMLAQKLHDQAQVLAQLEQRVKEQMIARRRTGETQNLGTSNAPVKPGRRQQKLDELNPFKQPERMAGLGRSRNQMRNYQQSLMGSGGVGRFQAIGDSSSGVTIPGVKEGSFTALNTDQLTYYSFYSRVNEAIVHRWVSNVREYVLMLPPTMQAQLARSPNTTVLEIVLNSKGEFLEAILHKTSGDTNLDSAALRPFKEAAPFLNPPAEMPGPDGKIRLMYQFTLSLY